MPTISAHMIVAREIDSVQESSVGEAGFTICEGCDSELKKVSLHNPKVPQIKAKIQQIFAEIILRPYYLRLPNFPFLFTQKKHC